jgi:TFIIF-interacting CTD phosphatase-like protein
MFVQLRPYLNHFLERVAPLYTLVLFTSATQAYADEVWELIDPNHKYFAGVFSRKHCVEAKNKVADS